MDEKKKQQYIDRMIDNLPVLRAKRRLTQRDLAELIGVSNYSISGMEKRQRKMTWNTFMSLLPVFLSDEESAELLRVFGIYTDELESLFRTPAIVRLSDDDLDMVAAAGVQVPPEARKKRRPPRQ